MPGGESSKCQRVEAEEEIDPVQQRVNGMGTERRAYSRRDGSEKPAPNENESHKNIFVSLLRTPKQGCGNDNRSADNGSPQKDHACFGKRLRSSRRGILSLIAPTAEPQRSPRG